MNHPLLATTLTIVFMEKVMRQRCAAVGAAMVKGVCGTVGVVLMAVTTAAACCLLVGVKITRAHAPASSRFLSFSRALCFFGGPGNQNDNISSCQATQTKKTRQLLCRLHRTDSRWLKQYGHLNKTYIMTTLDDIPA